jgi:eukaryotic-like serine/threonine-protein kinase
VAYAAPIGTELVEHLGAGTMFDVALVRESGVVVVCKRLSSRALREPVARAGFEREVGLLDRARHPALPTLIRAGEDGHGPFALESRAVGHSLRSIGEALRARGGAVPASLVADVVSRAAAALADLHELADGAGALAIIHGDVSPDHVFAAADGATQLVDFGGARFRGMAAVISDDRGTLPFAAPELARGDAELAREHDVYALAATLVAFATGEPLARATNAAALLLEIGERGVRVELADQVPGVDAAGREALRAALAFDPKERLASARELANRLGQRGCAG